MKLTIDEGNQEVNLDSRPNLHEILKIVGGQAYNSKVFQEIKNKCQAYNEALEKNQIFLRVLQNAIAQHQSLTLDSIQYEASLKQLQDLQHSELLCDLKEDFLDDIFDYGFTAIDMICQFKNSRVFANSLRDFIGTLESGQLTLD